MQHCLSNQTLLFCTGICSPFIVYSTYSAAVSIYPLLMCFGIVSCLLLFFYCSSYAHHRVHIVYQQDSHLIFRNRQRSDNNVFLQGMLLNRSNSQRFYRGMRINNVSFLVTSFFQTGSPVNIPCLCIPDLWTVSLIEFASKLKNNHQSQFSLLGYL